MKLNHFLFLSLLLLAINAHSQKDTLINQNIQTPLMPSSIEPGQFNFQSYWSAQNKTAIVHARKQQSVVFRNAGQTQDLSVDWRIVRSKRKKPSKGKQLLMAAPFYLLGADRIDETDRRKSDLKYGF